MKSIGWILIVVGIVMALIRGFSVPVEKNIVNARAIQINKTEHKWIGWPTYEGGVIAIVGIVMVASSKKST